MPGRFDRLRGSWRWKTNVLIIGPQLQQLSSTTVPIKSKVTHGPVYSASIEFNLSNTGATELIIEPPFSFTAPL